jgi:hypothetical protein
MPSTFRQMHPASAAIRAYDTSCQADVNAVPPDMRNRINSEMAFFQSGCTVAAQAIRGGAAVIPPAYGSASRRWWSFHGSLLGSQYNGQYDKVASCLGRWAQSVDPLWQPHPGWRGKIG